MHLLYSLSLFSLTAHYLYSLLSGYFNSYLWYSTSFDPSWFRLYLVHCLDLLIYYLLTLLPYEKVNAQCTFLFLSLFLYSIYSFILTLFDPSLYFILSFINHYTFMINVNLFLVSFLWCSQQLFLIDCHLFGSCWFKLTVISQVYGLIIYYLFTSHYFGKLPILLFINY